MRNPIAVPAVFLSLLSLSQAFIPCQPTNDTSTISLSDDFIQLNWQVWSGRQGVYRDGIARQLVADNSTQVGTQYAARGALVHFTEFNATQPASQAPFVAMINCDRNETSASQIDDIFTLSRDRGAVAALLYSTTSAACLINQDYIDNFEKPIDVYSTTSRQSALLMDSQFINVDSSSWYYNSALMNNSVDLIWQELNNTLYIEPASQNITSSTGETITAQPSGTTIDDVAFPSSIPSDAVTLLNPDTPTTDAPQTSSSALAKRQATSTSARSSQPATASAGIYLVAVLANQQTVFASNSTGSTPGPGNGQNSTGGGRSTGLAMIILYATTGCVTILFLIVILSGAIKAIRHPERYGPRAARGGPNGQQAQTRARGITRAMLDTFAVVKFRSDNTDNNNNNTTSNENDAEAQKREELEMEDVESGRMSTLPPPIAIPRQAVATTTATIEEDKPEPAPATHQETINPIDVDNQRSCPICVEDFEEGDNLRILPCQGQHAFHPDCIDPWLLGVSSLCPLCRLDLNADVNAADDEIVQMEEGETSRSGFMRRIRQRSRSNTVDSLHARDGTAGTTATSGSMASRFRRYVNNRRSPMAPDDTNRM